MEAHSTLIKPNWEHSKVLNFYTAWEINTSPQENTAQVTYRMAQGSLDDWNQSRKQMRFRKDREEEHTTWAGLAGVTSTDQRQEQIKATERLGRNRWSGPGPGRK